MKAQHGLQQLSSKLGMNSGANCALDGRNYKFSVSHIYKWIGQQTSLLLAIIKIKHLFLPKYPKWLRDRLAAASTSKWGRSNTTGLGTSGSEMLEKGQAPLDVGVKSTHKFVSEEHSQITLNSPGHTPNPSRFWGSSAPCEPLITSCCSWRDMATSEGKWNQIEASSAPEHS